VIGILSAVIVLTFLLALGAQAIVSRALCQEHPVVVNVAASVDIAQTVQRVGQYFNDLNRDIGGHCAEVEVSEVQPATAAAQVSGEAAVSGQLPVDAWIPDSTLWVDVARGTPGGEASVRPTGLSVAHSPLVIAMPRSVASKVIGTGGHVGWNFLFPAAAGGPAASLGLRVQLPDPAQSAAGMAALIEARRLLGNQRKGQDQLTSFVLNVQPTPALDDANALASFVALSQPPWNGRMVTVTTEQAVAQYNQQHSGQPITAIYPSGGSYDLDYPYVLTTSNTLKVRAAEEFGQVLRSSFATSYARYEGFRSADGAAAPSLSRDGLTAQAPAQVPQATAAEAETAIQSWNRLNLGSRDLALIDVSGAMAQRIGPGSGTRQQVLDQAATLGTSLFPDSTDMGLWEFASGLAGELPYKKLVPVGPLPGQLGLITRRQELLQIDAAAQPVPGTTSALYSTILAGFRQMTASYQPEHSNALLVLTAGIESAPGDPSLAALLTDLRSAYDPAHPVEIIIVAFGQGADVASLQQIASLTQGQAYTISQAADIGTVFFNAIARRLCQPGCPRN